MNGGNVQRRPNKPQRETDHLVANVGVVQFQVSCIPGALGARMPTQRETQFVGHFCPDIPVASVHASHAALVLVLLTFLVDIRLGLEPNSAWSKNKFCSCI